MPRWFPPFVGGESFFANVIATFTRSIKHIFGILSTRHGRHGWEKLKKVKIFWPHNLRAMRKPLTLFRAQKKGSQNSGRELGRFPVKKVRTSRNCWRDNFRGRLGQ
ncbi:MAG: hypothetical protein ABUL66_04610, partial [Verrucomicrobiota bacterium]